MSKFSRLNRRMALLSFGTASLGLTRFASAQSSLDATEFGVAGDTEVDQTAALQQGLDQAHISGQSLVLPPGRIMVSDLTFPAQFALEGSGSGTVLAAAGAGRIGVIGGVSRGSFTGIGFDGAGITDAVGILDVASSDGVSFLRCQFSGGVMGVQISDSAASIADCSFAGHSDAAIHALNSRGLAILGNRIAKCGNGGIRIWRTEVGADGSIISGNHIASIDWTDGGNGQNGNGINVFKADEVIIADNHINGCAFSAIRLNAARNSVVSGNVCTASGEVAIFSEFGFSGSIINGNIVDGAAGGISMTNFDQGGQLAVCSGNIVRNIAPGSTVNPDTTPFGIAAQADAAVTGNTVSNVPGLGITAGYGPFLRNVLVSGNVVTETDYGIAASVVDGCGPVQIANNLIESRKADVIGMQWQDIVSTDLAADAGRFPHVMVMGNS